MKEIRSILRPRQQLELVEKKFSNSLKLRFSIKSSRILVAGLLLPAISRIVDIKYAGGDRNIELRGEKLGHGLSAVPLGPPDTFYKRGLKIYLH